MEGQLFYLAQNYSCCAFTPELHKHVLNLISCRKGNTNRKRNCLLSPETKKSRGTITWIPLHVWWQNSVKGRFPLLNLWLHLKTCHWVFWLTITKFALQTRSKSFVHPIIYRSLGSSSGGNMLSGMKWGWRTQITKKSDWQQQEGSG